jgi:predicted amidophosphoribosyltransferase
MDKGNCSKCGQKIQKTTSNKCMYCGTPLQPDQAFTQEEKEEINLGKKVLKKELHEKEMDRIKQGRKSSSASVYPDITFGDGGF